MARAQSSKLPPAVVKERVQNDPSNQCGLGTEQIIPAGTWPLCLTLQGLLCTPHCLRCTFAVFSRFLLKLYFLVQWRLTVVMLSLGYLGPGQSQTDALRH